MTRASDPANPPCPPAAGRARRPLLALGFLAAVWLAEQGLWRASELRAAWPAEADTLYLPTTTTLRALSLGHTELLADLVAARMNVYFGTQFLARAPQRWLDRYLDTAIDLDPFFHRLYLSGAAMLIYGGPDITKERVLAANHVIERGLETFPYDWELYFYRGFNYLFELPGVAGNDPRVDDWRQKGVESMRQAALFEDAPPWLPSLAAKMLTKRGSEEMAIKHLEQAYAAAASAAARLQIKAKLARLRGQQHFARLEEERRRFEQLLTKGYPYAPDAFSVVAGPRKSHAVDLSRDAK